MIVDDSLVNWFVDKVENHDSEKARALKKWLKGGGAGMTPRQFLEGACEGKGSLQEVADELLIDNPPDRSVMS